MPDEDINANGGGKTGENVFRLPVILTVLLAVLLVASVACNVVLWSKYSQVKAGYDGVFAQYSENFFHFTSITTDLFEAKVASGEEFIVLISRPDCSNCLRLEMPFIRLTEEKGISDRVYYLNVARIHRDAKAWTAFKDAYGLEGTPTYIRFKDGKNVSCVGWTNERSVDFDAVREWIEAQADFFGN